MDGKIEDGEGLRFGLVGLGSMGKRRIRNLHHLGYKDIVGFDIRMDRREETEKLYNIRTVDKFDQALAILNFNAVIISTPPDFHEIYARKCIYHGIPCFIEQDTFDWGVKKTINYARKKNVLVAPSCTLHHYSLVKKMKKLLDNGELGKPWAFTCHAGEHLSNWHPWEGLDFYMSDKKMGGIFEMVNFDLVWLTWLFGYPTRVTGSIGKVSDIETDIYDLANLVMHFPSGVVGHLLSNVISRVKERVCRIFCEKALVTWNWGDSLDVDDGKQHETFYPTERLTHGGYSNKIKEEPYIQEMRDFIGAVNGEIVYPYTLEEVRDRLRIVSDLERKLRSDI